MAAELGELNEAVVELAAARRYRTEVREDGERVIRLPGKGGAHAGRWGEQTSYLLVPCSQPARRAAILLRGWPGLEDRSSDAEVLMLGPHGVVEAVLASGPTWARARRRKAAGAADHLTAYRKPPTGGDSGSG